MEGHWRDSAGPNAKSRGERRLREIVRRQSRLLSCYRIGSPPSGKMLDQLAADREWLAEYDKAEGE